MDAEGLWQSCQQLGIGIVTCKDEEFSKVTVDKSLHILVSFTIMEI